MSSSSAVAIGVGTHVYIPDLEDLWLHASILSHEPSKHLFRVKITYDESEMTLDLKNLKLQNLLQVHEKTTEFVATLPLANTIDSSDVTGVQDMISLGHLHEPAILFNVKKRFKMALPCTFLLYSRVWGVVYVNMCECVNICIYVNGFKVNLSHTWRDVFIDTFSGNICIAVNPYQWLPELYDDETQLKYLAISRSELPPHVYATSVAAFRGEIYH